MKLLTQEVARELNERRSSCDGVQLAHEGRDGSVHKAPGEARALGKQAAELFVSHQGEINVAPGGFADGKHEAAELAQVGVSDDEHIYVAVRSSV